MGWEVGGAGRKIRVGFRIKFQSANNTLSDLFQGDIMRTVWRARTDTQTRTRIFFLGREEGGQESN